MPRLIMDERSYSLRSSNVTTGLVVPNSPSLNPTAAVALEIQFKPVADGSMTLFDNSQLGVTNSYYAFVDGLGKLYWYSTIGGVAKNIIGTTARARLGEWNMAHWVYDGSMIRIFLNGEQIATLAATGSLGVNSGPLRIGQYYSGGVAQNCKFTKPRIYSRVFTLQDHKDRFYLKRDDDAMRTGLVLDMRFTEGNGSVAGDSSGLGNNGTITGPVWDPDSPSMPRIRAQSFYGSLEHKSSFNNAVRTSGPVGITDSYSFGGWTNWAGENGAGQVVMGIETTPTNPNIGVGRNVINGSFPWTSGAVKNIPGLFYPNKWVHIILTYDASTNTGSIFFNGVRVFRGTGTLYTPFSVNRFYLGVHPGTGLPYNGKNSDAYVWNRAITDEEVAGIYHRRVIPSSGLRLFWDMSNQSGNTVTDLSGNGNHGTVISTALWSLDCPSNRRVLLRDNPYSLLMNGVNSTLVKTSPTGLPTGTSPRSVIISMFFASEDVACVIDMHVNSAQSFAPILGKLGSSYVIFSDRINVGNNLTMTADEFRRLVGVGRWRRIAYTYDGGTSLKFYVDGKLAKVLTLGVPLNTGTINTLLVASGLTSAQTNLYPFNGYHQDAIICNTELTGDEVADEYFSGKVPSSAVTRIKVTEGTGSTAADSIGSNHCTLSNASWSVNTRFKLRTPAT